MNPMISSSKLLAAALCGVVLAGCNAVEDVREEPFTPVPTQGVVLQGQVTGTLGRQRSVTLVNNGDVNGARSVAATLGTPFTPFNFGIVPAGSPYNITVRSNPYGKICTVTNGSGTVTTPEALNITVNCVNDPAVTRYFLRVTVPSTFGSIAGAKVILTTEEGVYERTPAAGATSVQFDSSVFNAASTAVPAPPAGSAAFAWTVTATTTAGSTAAVPLVNRCVVTNGTGSNPTTNVGVSGSLPTVGACSFTIGGTSVAYNTPAGGVAQAMPVGGLDLQLRDVQGAVVETLTYTGAYGAAGGYTFTTPGRSNPTAVYDVAVSRHPTGHYCVVANGGAATLGVATANITNANVVCRAIPAAPNRLRGTYEFRSGTTFGRATAFTAGTTTVIGVNDVTTTYLSTTSPGLGGASRGQNIVTATTLTGASTSTATSVTTTNNTITRNALTLFEDGTFLHGVHAGNQVEHGFYNWNPTTRVITFTIVTDTTAGGTSSLLTTGLSGTGGTATVGGFVTATMTNVVKGTSDGNGTLSGDFGTPVALVSSTVPAVNTRWSNWLMVEPQTVAGQMTGTWVSQDHRRQWIYDFNTTLGFHTGVNGGAANMQDGCFTLDDYTATSGFYTRRGGLTGCLDAVSLPAGIGTVDFQSPTLANTPGFVGRVPGSETAFDGRSPSPIYFQVGPPGTFFSLASPAYFPVPVGAAPMSWCTTDVLGIRASLHGVAINTPVYFCRERAN